MFLDVVSIDFIESTSKMIIRFEKKADKSQGNILIPYPLCNSD